jgi:hypothetical protein
MENSEKEMTNKQEEVKEAMWHALVENRLLTKFDVKQFVDMYWPRPQPEERRYSEGEMERAFADAMEFGFLHGDFFDDLVFQTFLQSLTEPKTEQPLNGEGE